MVKGMGNWMTGWMDRWVNGRMDILADKRMARLMVECLVRWMDGYIIFMEMTD